MLKRIIIALIFIPAFLAILFNDNIYIFNSLIVAGLIIALFEYFNLFENKSLKPQLIIGVSMGIIMLICTLFSNEHYYSNIIFTVIILISVMVQVKKSRTNFKDSDIFNIIITFFGVYYVCWMGMHIILLRKISAMPVFLLFLVTWISDSGAYFTGTLLGKRKLAEAISPFKTKEGFIGAIIFGTASLMIVKYMFPEFITVNYIHCIILGLLVSVFSQFGDLFESMLKRYASVKDSSNLIPGHGGILDKIDGLVFGAPVVYYYFVIFIV